ncbi:MAG: aldo/keto reductase [Phycisphaerae bacterium]|nr:aldo/keto reductase [Phycisphaerae bacterium]
MRYRPYGNTGREISLIGFGGMRFPRPEKIDESAEVVLHAYHRGVNYFDTAPGYCGDHSEEIIGAAVREMKPGTYSVSTKSGREDGGELRRQLETSLKRIGVERIDFFHIWCIVTPDEWPRRVRGGAVAAALKAKEEGLIGHVVVSAHLAGDELTRLLDEGPFEGVTLGYNAINFPYRQEALFEAGRRGLGVVTMNPLGGGLIPKNAERFDFIRSAADASVVAAALRFNLSHSAVTCALVGFSNTRQVDEAVDAVENFRPHDSEHIAALREKIIAEFNDLCTGCRYCLPCPAGVDIPRLMEAYDFATLNGGDPKHIRDRLHWQWDLTPAAAADCTQCGLCEQRCTQHLPIRQRLARIAALDE